LTDHVSGVFDFTGFLTDDLVNQDEGAHKKYLGVCQLPGGNRKVGDVTSTQCTLS